MYFTIEEVHYNSRRNVELLYTTLVEHIGCENERKLLTRFINKIDYSMSSYERKAVA